ncbi:MAG: ABC transporter ATP-binding protein, partial [Neglectibacter sp.]
THNEEIAQMADRTIRIEDGKVVSGGVKYAR